MRVLVACECSQTVCKEFRALGHEAYSCDIEKEYGGHPSGKARCWEEMVKETGRQLEVRHFRA